ncbi:Allantoicase [Caballeronia glathei]|uniref:Probable allantoicase n=1 Tax=Caballeronia glathei TaxID=60547 RepID=A0A069PP36_9BURK|nr:allantoicase [Caballeronia glathei]KDR39066.1 allantoicase [Caballeronia glathei]CDY78894.1 Allantoicase [Caballeronia glathei]
MAMPTFDPDAPAFARTGINLADPRLGARAVLTSDDFFAPMARILDPEPAVFIPGKYDDNGKWMDGWESRRKRVAGHDFCIVKLGVAGELVGVDIDTSHFTGNFPPAASIDACRCDSDVPPADARWTEVLPAIVLKGNAHHYHAIDPATRGAYTHVRLNIYPDGGVARLRVFGRPRRELAPGGELDLASAINGARIVAANNQHYGLASNLLLPMRAANMGEGWETRRRREPGCDWCIVELATPGEISQVRVDTAHFKGNFADRCSLQGAFVSAGTDESVITQSMFWQVLLDEQKLEMDRVHTFAPTRSMSVTHVRFNILPDGGVSRLNLMGRALI